MARVICKTVYTYEELSDSAKQQALSEAAAVMDYGWEGENADTLKAFCRIFPVKVRDFEYGYHAHISHYLTCDDEVANLTGWRLLRYLWNNYKADLYKGKYYHKGNKSRHSRIIMEADCVLTGYCADEDILEPIYKFMDKPLDYVTFEDLMEACLESWLSYCHADYESYYSEESMADTFAANDYEFYEDGSLV